MPYPKKLLEKRPLLEELLHREHETCSINLELRIYDIMLHAVDQYHANLEADLAQAISTLSSGGSETGGLSREYQYKSLVLSMISKYRKAPAYIFVLDFEPEKKEHAEHIFAQEASYHRPCIGKPVSDDSIVGEMDKIAYEDNAILIAENGKITATNVQLVDVNPACIPVNAQVAGQSIDRYGFAERVYSRHYSALSASFQMDTKVYTLGEEGNIRRFHKGRITFSTHDIEMETIGTQTR